jgi:hypothetical protein
LTKREACIQAALSLKAQLHDCEGKLQLQGQELKLRLDQLSNERDRMSEQIAVLERDLKAAVAENAILAAEKSAAGQQLDVRLR